MPAPQQIVDKLSRWAEATEWVEWLELSGSLGRGAGDERSDVDAGIGVIGTPRLDAVEDAAAGFAPVASSLRQPFGDIATHLITVYDDGMQLSLVVMGHTVRTGLPPQAVALVDKTNRLGEHLDRTKWDPGRPQRKEWAFLACIAAGDALKHSRRGSQWRTVQSLHEARQHYLQLVAASEQVIFPQFGAVSLENAGRPIPADLVQTLIGAADQESIRAATAALMVLLRPFIAEHELGNLAQALARPGS